MKVLELFSGTGSVGKICKEMSWEVISLDLKGADINTNILNWDYTQYPVGHFDLIWASPPCDTFSQLRRTWVGKKLKCHHGEVCTHELLQHDIDTIGLPILRKTEEIIAYFNPKYYFIENPQTGHMKTYMMHHPHYDIDYLWPKEKTDFLFDLCRKYDLIWPIIADRLDTALNSSSSNSSV